MRILCSLFFLLGALPDATAQQVDTAPSLAPLRAKPERTAVHPVYHGSTMIVKFRHDSGVHLDGNRFAHTEGTNINAILQQVAVERARLIQLPEEQLEALRRSGEARSGLRLHDLNLFFRIELADRTTMAQTCDRLNAFDLVEIAYPAPTVSDPLPPARPPFVSPRFAPSLSLLASPDFSGSQNYRNAAPTGIDADYGEFFSGSRGENTLIADVETGWTDDHEDIKHKALNAFIGLSPAPYPWDHGTAVLGELIGEDNGFGVRGIVHQADVALSSHLGSSANIATAIAFATAATGVGDAVVLEVQCFGGVPGPFPCEYDPAIFAIVQTATANGVHVFAAAGNGTQNLDSPVYGGAFDRNVRDSGAVLVGASDGSALVPAWFSNYGSRLDAHGWGQNVTTSGYGDLYFGSGVTTEYTAVFSGTSSATPIVTGAGLMLNGIHREAFGTPMTPLDLRALLTATGTPQISGNPIGPRPDVRAAIQALAIPTLTRGGTLVPGGTLELTLDASAGDSFALLFSRSLASSPQHNAPFGYLYLGPILHSRNGILPGSGSRLWVFSVPNNPALSGTTPGYAQAQVTFASGPGTGSYTNYVPIEIQ